MSFMLYLMGFIIFLAGLAYGAVRLGVDSLWVGIGVVILLGLGILTGVTKTRQRDPSEPTP
jgi:hypothetical protein